MFCKLHEFKQKQNERLVHSMSQVNNSNTNPLFQKINVYIIVLLNVSSQASKTLQKLTPVISTKEIHYMFIIYIYKISPRHQPRSLFIIFFKVFNVCFKDQIVLYVCNLQTITHAIKMIDGIKSKTTDHK